MVQENIYQQIVFGIRQLVNGEGGSGRIIDMSVDADNNAIVVELAEMTDSFREALMDDIHEQRVRARVVSIVPGDDAGVGIPFEVYLVHGDIIP